MRAPPDARQLARCDARQWAASRWLRSGRQHSVSAATVIPVDPCSAFALLADLDQHWRFAGGFAEVLELQGPAGARAGGLLRVRGPFGIRRTVATRVLHARAPSTVAGAATAGHGTSARIVWRLSGCESGTTVELFVRILHVRGIDRALLSTAGRRWLRRQLGFTLQRFAAATAGESAQLRQAA